MFSLFEKKKIYFQFHYIDAFDKYKIISDYGLSSVWWQAIIKNKNNGLLSLASLGIDFEQWIFNGNILIQENAFQHAVCILSWPNCVKSAHQSLSQ